MNFRQIFKSMPRSLLGAFKLIAIILTPIALIGFVISRREISGDQYVAVLEIFGNDTQPGAVEIFGADIQTISSLLKFFETWSLPALIAIVVLGLVGLGFSKDKLRSTWHFCLGLFFSFGVWAAFLTRSHATFSNFADSAVSDLSALVIREYLFDISAELLNLLGFLALVFGSLAFGLWALAKRLRTSTQESLN